MSSAPEDAVSLLRSLKAAGEKTGAVEAEGALHLRRISRRTLDGVHDVTAIIQPTVSLPSPKFPSPSGGNPAGAGAALTPTLSVPQAPSPTAGSSSPRNFNANAAHGGTLPHITSTASSPAASPSRLAARPPTPLGSVSSPSAGSPGGATAGAPAGSSSAPGASGTSPISPPPPALLLGPGLNRRASQASATIPGTSLSHDPSQGQMPHSHGSPLPLILDLPFASGAPAPGPAGAAPTGPQPVASTGPPSPSLRLAAAGGGSPGPASSSLPSIGSSGGAGAVGGTGNGPPPFAPGGSFAMFSLLSASSPMRIQSARSSGGGAPMIGGISSSCGALPTGRTALRPSGVSSSGVALPPAAGGSPHGPAQAPGPLGSPTLSSARSPASELGSPSEPRLLQPPQQPPPAPHLQHQQQQQFQSPQPRASSARTGSIGAPAPTIAEGAPVLSSSLSHRRLSMTGGFELTLGGSQKLVMAAAHELSTITQHGHHASHGNTQNGHGMLGHTQQQSGGQQPPPLPLQQLQLLLPPPALQPQGPGMGQHSSPLRPGFSSARGPGSMGTDWGPAGLSSSPGVVQSGPEPVRQAPRDGRLSDPGLPAVATAAAAGAASPAGAGAATTGQPGSPTPVGRPNLAPLPTAAVQAARAVTPPVAVSSSAGGLVPFSPTSSQTHARSQRPDPLPASARRSSNGGVGVGGAISSPGPSPTAPPTLLTRAGALAPMVGATPTALGDAGPAAPGPLAESVFRSTPDFDSAALSNSARAHLDALPASVRRFFSGGFGIGTAAISPGRSSVTPPTPLIHAGMLAPMLGATATAQGDTGAAKPGPVAESALGSTPDLDPAALFNPAFGSGSGSRQAAMELTVRSIAAQPGAATTAHSSVRQKIQVDPLQFHPPLTAAGGMRRQPGGGPVLDPLEATPRLILGAPRMRLTSQTDGGGGTISPQVGAAEGLWVPSRDILPHLVGRVSSAGSGSTRWSPATTTAAAAATAAAARGPVTISCGGGDDAGGGTADVQTPRLRGMSTNGDHLSPPGSARLPSTTPATPALPHVQPHVLTPLQPQLQLRLQPQDPRAVSQQPKGWHSNYLQALAAAAGLGLDDSGGRPRPRSLSDSGCSAFLAAVDCGPVGLSLEGGLGVLGGDMWSRLRAEQHHNTRYDEAADPEGAADLSGTLDEAAGMAVADQAKALLLKETGHKGTANGHREALGPQTPLPDRPVKVMGTATTAAASSSRAPLVRPSTSPAGAVPPAVGSGRMDRGGAGGGSVAASMAVGPSMAAAGHVRLDASVSSLPLKALRAPLGGAGKA